MSLDGLRMHNAVRPRHILRAVRANLLRQTHTAAAHFLRISFISAAVFDMQLVSVIDMDPADTESPNHRGIHVTHYPG